MTEQQQPKKAQQTTQPASGEAVVRLSVLTPGDPIPETMQKEFDNGKGEQNDE